MFENISGFILKPIASLANSWPWLGGKINTIAINSSVNVCRHRPHPWSTVHDYVSWTSLTDQRWSARHLPAKNKHGLPSPEVLKNLFIRKQGGQEFCKKSTCLFPAFAQYLTDGFIRTRMPNTSAGEKDDPLRKQNTSNHQIDLCTLYGRTPEQTSQLRINSEDSGLKGQLKSQTISNEEYSPFLFEADGQAVKAEFNTLDKPLSLDKCSTIMRTKLFATGGDRVNSAPQVAMINTLFLREHNRLAKEIEKANTDWDDERVFQTARNTVIVLFIKIVVEEYINHISPAPFRFLADPSVAWNAPWNKPNWITAEFSLLYRWHSLIPDNMEWSGKYHPVAETLMNNQLLLDAGLGGAFASMSAQQAARLGAFNTNTALIGFEVKAIEQGRLCKLDSYANYREYVSLEKPNAFSDISKNKSIVDFLAANYSSPDDVDFYIGLFAEDTERNSPLPPLILRMVAVDAFSQAFTNPLLSEHVFRPDTFSTIGWNAIQNTRSLRDILIRNISKDIGDTRISMTLSNWRFS
ncbi:MAG: heme peroxidase [Methyloglobulus sp.]|nr:heme peroxidase [Methyloglobulus sp.]